MLSATTQGLRDLGQFKKRLANDFGKNQFSWTDFQYINERVVEIEDRLVEIASGNPSRLSEDQALTQPA